MKNKKLFAILTLVCFMMTLMPVAAFAAVDTDTSYIFTVKSNPTVKLNASNEAYAAIAVDLADDAGNPVTTGSVAVWFTEAGKTTAATAFKGLYTWNSGTESYDAVTGFNDTTDVHTATLTTGTTYYAKFVRAGEFTVNASFAPALVLADSALLGTDAANKVITVKGAVNDEYTISYNGTAYADGARIAYGSTVLADNVTTSTVTMNLSQNTATPPAVTAGANVKGATVSITTNSSNLEVSKEKVTTNALGNFSFGLTGVREGNYEVYISYGSYEVTLTVTVGSTDPAYITVAKAPTAPIDIDATGNLSNIVRFVITDINGNIVPAATFAGTPIPTPTPTAAFGAINATSATVADGAYAAIVDAPADSDLGDEDVTLAVDTHNSNWATGMYYTLNVANGFDAEGTYKFKVALNNGNAVYVTVEVAEFGTPVGIVLEYAAPSVELGGVLNAKDFLLVDAKGVTTPAAAKGVELAASGYAVSNFNGTTGAITVKTDEKYLGSTINVTAVSERYNLTTTTSVKVVAEAAGLMFVGKTAEVNVNNAIQVVLVDAQGNRTAFGNAAADTAAVDVDYLVLAKPEGAKVAVNTSAADENLLSAGSFKMNLTCDKVGTVKVQAIAKISKTVAGELVTKYYTGVGEIAVGTGEIGKSVVLSIGSSTMIVDGKAVELENTKAIIKDNRTFVPFRALAEAFGAKVEYNAADHSVVATLNGVTVVMPIGETTYTVNGIAKTADVAPFVDESNRTLVPVKFVADAFGIQVTPVYNDNGTVADVLFNM